MNLSEKNNHFKKLIQLKVGVGPESELESDNRNCPESESALESDDETSDSTALVSTPTNPLAYALVDCARICVRIVLLIVYLSEFV